MEKEESQTLTKEDAEAQFKRIRAVHVPEESMFPLDLFRLPSSSLPYFTKMLVPDGLVASRVDRIASEMHEQYSRLKDELSILVIMDGAFQFYSMILSALQKLLHLDNAPFRFRAYYVTLKTYINDKVGDKRCIDPGVFVEKWIKGKEVLVVEDVYDSGNLMH